MLKITPRKDTRPIMKGMVCPVLSSVRTFSMLFHSIVSSIVAIVIIIEMAARIHLISLKVRLSISVSKSFSGVLLFSWPNSC